MWGLGRDVWCWWCVLAFVAHVLHASRGGSQGGWLYEGGDGAGGIGDIIVDRSKLGGGALAASCGGAAHDFYHIVQSCTTYDYDALFSCFYHRCHRAIDAAASSSSSDEDPGDDSEALDDHHPKVYKRQQSNLFSDEDKLSIVVDLFPSPGIQQTSYLDDDDDDDNNLHTPNDNDDGRAAPPSNAFHSGLSLMPSYAILPPSQAL